MKSIFQSNTRNRRYRQIQPEQQAEQEPFFAGAGHTAVQQKPQPFFQPKLTVGQPGDPYEREADAAADAVVNHSAGQQPVLQRQPITPVGSMGSLQRLATPEEEEKPVQTKSDTGARSAPTHIGTRLSEQQGSGNPLPKSVKSEMEHSFGVDFSGVNIHTDTEAIQLNRELGAQAFTHGQDVYFNSGKFSPEQTEGKRLLAHELTHVVQQKFALNRIQRYGHDKYCTDAKHLKPFIWPGHYHATVIVDAAIAKLKAPLDDLLKLNLKRLFGQDSILPGNVSILLSNFTKIRNALDTHYIRLVAVM